LTQLRDVLRELSRVDDAATSAKAARLNAVPPGAFVTTAAIPAQETTQETTQDATQSARQAAGQGAEFDEDGSRQDPEQAQRLRLLRAQQSVLQADKSQQELLGVATRVEDIRLQLINNRIDSIDRQTRLHDRVYLPLESVLDKEMEDFRGRLNQLQTASMSPQGNGPQATAAADANDRVLVALDAIIANMLDLESFNEIIDLVRGILDDEERLLDETQKKQKQGLLDLLKK
jgi:hypothetical protein